MKKLIFLAIILGTLFAVQSFAQKDTDSHIIGHVVSEGEHLPYVSVSIKGTTMGTLTDETGHFTILNVPLGKITVVASSVGYIPQQIEVEVKKAEATEVKFDLEVDVLNINEVVVSSDRSAQKRTEAPIIISTLPSKLFESTSSATLGEGLAFTPGIRLENDCQNCGFSQVRLNGMEGPYSQILINSRPIFSGLAGVYGLELIPANMIERVEVTRGSGSAMFGSNAIAGTINVILKDPVNNNFEVGGDYNLVGIGKGLSPAIDYKLNFNTSLVTNSGKSGMVLYGFTRERTPFDVNNDTFSEIAQLENLTIGSRFFHRFGHRAKVSVDLFNIKEEREGGNMHELPFHEREIAEMVNHDIKTFAVNYEQFFRDYDFLSIYASGQHLDRKSYYGANKSLKAYGRSVDFTYNVGAQYKTYMGKSTVVTGIEQTSGTLKDEKLGYPDITSSSWAGTSLDDLPHIGNTTVAHQRLTTRGVFSQYELTLIRTKLNVGGRLDYYSIQGLSNDVEPKSGYVFSPRVSLMHGITKDLQGRLSYAQGYRAPQIFDEDLHIEASGARQVYHTNDPDLVQENSHSITASFDFNGELGSIYTGVLLEGFSTWLVNPFVNLIGAPDETGRVVYTRTNSEAGAMVQGANLELKFSSGGPLTVNSGFTLQRSLYTMPQDFDEKRFFRTPNRYGYVRFDYEFTNESGLNVNASYTGPMLVPYFGPQAADPAIGELRTSSDFLDLGVRFYFTFPVDNMNIQWFGGVKNIFNSYQKDYDIGIGRDPSYIYGPMAPRTIFIGLKVGN